MSWWKNETNSEVGATPSKLDELKTKAEEVLDNLWDKLDKRSEVEEFAEKAKAQTDILLDKYMVDIKRDDLELSDDIQNFCDNINRIVNDALMLLTVKDHGLITEGHDPKKEIYRMIFNPEMWDKPPLFIAALIYATVVENSSRMISKTIDTSLIEVRSREIPLYSDMLIGQTDLADGIMFEPGLRDKLMSSFGIPENEINETLVKMKETVLNSSEAMAYLLANLGLGTARFVEKAIKGIYGPTLAVMGDGERAAELLSNMQTDEWKNKLEEVWDKNQLEKFFDNMSLMFGEESTIIALSVLACSGLLLKYPQVAVPVYVALATYNIRNDLAEATANDEKLDQKEALSALAATAAQVIASLMIPTVNGKIQSFAPKVTNSLSKLDINNVDQLAKWTGTLIKAAMGAADAGIHQAADETRKYVRYVLDIDENFDVVEELKNSALTVTLASVISGAMYYGKETIRYSKAFADAFQKLTGHAFVPAPDEFETLARDFVDVESRGGSYKELVELYRNQGKHIHHIPADASSKLEKNDGPAIAMDPKDHMRTASWGPSAEAKEYRRMQKELIEKGEFRKAIQMDIDDLHEKFDGKYDEEIKQMLSYVDKLVERGMV